MKRTLSLIIAASLLALSFASCDKTSPKETERETDAPETQAVEIMPSETEASAPSYNYSTSLIVENRAAKSHIVIAEDADDLLTYAAEELVYHVQKISGVELSVFNTAQNNSLPIIVASPDTHPELEELFPEDLNWLRTLEEEDGRRWGDDGFAIREHEGKIYIFGATSNGALNGTHEFIEENMGVLWVRGDESIGLVYEEADTITVSRVGYREKSPFQIRGMALSGHKYTDLTEIMFSRNKMNSASKNNAEDKGIITIGAAHNVKQLILNSPVYDPEVKEYWNTTAAGEYLGYQASEQINYWSDKAAEAVAASVIASLKAGTLYPFIGMEDTSMGRNIPEDTLPFEYAPGQFVEPTEKDYKSTVYFSFINKVARLVKAECPDGIFVTFAYGFAEDVPRCALEDNFYIIFAPINEDLTVPLDDPDNENNSAVLKRLEQWKTRTKNIIFWNYFGCFKADGQYSRPIWDRIQENLQYYTENGFYGMFAEGEPDDTAGSGLWTMNSMILWIYQKLCWNPYENVDALIAEYCDKCYGDASAYMQEYYRLVKQGWEAGREYLPYPYKWNVEWLVYLDSFLDNDEFTGEHEGLLERVLEVLTLAVEAADDVEKLRIAPIKNNLEQGIAAYS